jgi:RNase adapter protein RapZ
MIADLIAFLEKRIGEFSQANRSYLTIAVGCTGGVHRSVYVAEQLAQHFSKSHPQVLTRHDSLQKN